MRLAALAIALLPLTITAQTRDLLRTDPSRGVTLPPTSTATIDDASALSVNPAALSSVGRAQLLYFHERSIARSQTGDAVYLGTSLAGALGLGFGADWMRGPQLTDYRRLTWALSLGSPNFSLGAALHTFASEESADLDALSSWDFGLIVRPARFLSLGFTARNLDRPSRGSTVLGRELDLGIGVRPWGERLTLAVDWFTDPEAPLDSDRLMYTLQGRVLKGLTVGAGLSHSLGGRDALAFQLSATIDSESLGLTYAGGSRSEGMDHLVGVRLGGGPYPGLDFGIGRIALIDLDDLLSTSTGAAAALLGIRREDPFIQLVRLLEHAERDPLLDGVVLKITDLPDTGFGKAEELRQSMIRLREAGKKVYAVLLTAGDAEYHVASAAERIYAVPEATLPINGLSASVTFLGGTMDKLGVKWNVARVGAYKNAPDQLTRSGIAPEHEEALGAFLDSQVRTIEATVPAARGISVAQFRAALAQGILTPQRALEQRLVDQIVTPSELDAHLRNLNPGSSYVARYRATSEKTGRWGGRTRIAIVPVIGSISGGKSRDNPLGGGTIAGAETVVRALQQAQQDPSVAAIVVRVDSGGGDGLASDLMYRAVLDAKKVKPVVASMGDIAASGGYYAAMGADEVFASPTTLTGSIGVFVLKPAIQGLGEKLGASQVTLKRAPFADALGTWRPWTPEEQQVAQRWVDEFYDHFITEVASARKLDKAKVDTVARGRIWSGADAKLHGLVDTLGGLQQALESARRRAKVGDDVVYTVFGEPAGLFSSLGGEEGVDTSLLDGVLPRSPTLPEPWRSFAAELGPAAALLEEPGVKAALPFQVTVE